jgi:methylitaconate Delta-isomerase
VSRRVAERRTVRCVAMRGGTTRGFFFRGEDLPSEPRERDELLLSMIAGADGHQADAMGGADLLLSKVVLVTPSGRPDCHVDVSFGAVTPGSARIKYGSNCGNLSAAVALFAVEERLAGEPGEPVRIFNPDSAGIVEARLGAPTPRGEHGGSSDTSTFDAGPRTGVPVELAFVSPTGTLGSGALPTGRAIDRVDFDGLPVEITVVDSAAVYAFVPSRAVGLERAAFPDDRERIRALLGFADRVRRQVAVMIGAAPSIELADAVSPNIPKIAFISRAEESTADLAACIVSSQSLHHAYAVTGAIATSTASVIEGSVVARLVGPRAQGRCTLRIAHPGGLIEPSIDWCRSAEGVVVDRAYLRRTARRLMTGQIHAPLAAPVHATRSSTIAASASAPVSATAATRPNARVRETSGIEAVRSGSSA